MITLAHSPEIVASTVVGAKRIDVTMSKEQRAEDTKRRKIDGGEPPRDGAKVDPPPLPPPLWPHVTSELRKARRECPPCPRCPGVCKLCDPHCPRCLLLCGGEVGFTEFRECPVCNLRVQIWQGSAVEYETMTMFDPPHVLKKLYHLNCHSLAPHLRVLVTHLSSDRNSQPVYM